MEYETTKSGVREVREVPGERGRKKRTTNWAGTATEEVTVTRTSAARRIGRKAEVGPEEEEGVAPAAAGGTRIPAPSQHTTIIATAPSMRGCGGSRSSRSNTTSTRERRQTLGQCHTWMSRARQFVRQSYRKTSCGWPSQAACSISGKGSSTLSGTQRVVGGRIGAR
eukprot:16434661-Heterocapsa_arctica.AAC.1